MINAQKIKKLIIILISMIIFTLSCIFYDVLNPIFINLFAERFNVVSNKGNLLVHFIDVDQADACAINLPDGKVMLIDTGGERVNTTYVNYLKENVLNTERKNYIDYLVLSHADMDHIGGTMKLLQNFSVGTIFMPKVASDSNGYAEILNYVDANCNYTFLGDEFSIVQNNYSIKFFEILNNTNTNDSSQLVKLEYRNKSFLFCGDISMSIDDEYIELYGDELDCDVLKVAHHGAKTATSQEFLEIVTPEYAVISVGEDNDYGHPTFEVLNRLNKVGAKILRTDEKTDVLFVVGKNYNLFEIDGTYYITKLSLNYISIVFVLDVGCVVMMICIIIKKEKNKHLK